MFRRLKHMRLKSLFSTYSFVGSCFALFLANTASATNVIDPTTGGTIANDPMMKQWTDVLNWGLSGFGMVFAAILGFGALKHIKHGEYASAVGGLSASALAGAITYFVHTYFSK